MPVGLAPCARVAVGLVVGVDLGLLVQVVARLHVAVVAVLGQLVELRVVAEPVRLLCRAAGSPRRPRSPMLPGRMSGGVGRIRERQVRDRDVRDRDVRDREVGDVSSAGSGPSLVRSTRRRRAEQEERAHAEHGQRGDDDADDQPRVAGRRARRRPGGVKPGGGGGPPATGMAGWSAPGGPLPTVVGTGVAAARRRLQGRGRRPATRWRRRTRPAEAVGRTRAVAGGRSRTSRSRRTADRQTSPHRRRSSPCSLMPRPGGTPRSRRAWRPRPPRPRRRRPASRSARAAAPSVAPVVDHVVDHEDAPGRYPRAGPGTTARRSRRARPSPVCGPADERPLEQAATRHAELAGDVAGDQLGLVEAPPAPSPTPGRRPGDHVDATPQRGQPVDQEAGQVTGDRPGGCGT